MKAESKRLAHMRQNPKADWTIKDVEALCKEYDILFAAPRGGGSHCKNRAFWPCRYFDDSL